MNYLGLSPESLDAISDKLNQLLADYQVYYQNLRNYHWNVTGEHFFDLHIKFEDLYNEARINIDEVAERILTLRKLPMSTLASYLKYASIKERSTDNPKEMVANILDDHKVLIGDIRALIANASEAGDEGTIDLVAGFLSSIEKNSWMLDAWLNR